jgi:hypothetical protein
MNKILVVALEAQHKEIYDFRPGYASPAGRHEKLPAARAGHETDMRSHLCRRDMRRFCTFQLGHACRSQFVQM